MQRELIDLLLWGVGVACPKVGDDGVSPCHFHFHLQGMTAKTAEIAYRVCQDGDIEAAFFLFGQKFGVAGGLGGVVAGRGGNRQEIRACGEEENGINPRNPEPLGRSRDACRRD